ncbi:MAG TPA: carbonic anhydrase [Chromobacteriaceae bacterium]|nr:carbonic anhydrase [Chromobacteriaceae bacterium]
MGVLNTILEHNRAFVENREYEKFKTDKFPDKGLAILSCMDARMVELLPKSMGLKNGDVKLIKNAGALVTHPWGSVMRSLIVAVYELRAEEICVVAHRDCGMRAIDPERVLQHAVDRGISPDTITTLRAAGIDLDTWLQGFDNVNDSVRHTVQTIRNHPLLPKDIPVHGLVIHPSTGRLEVIIDGYTGEAPPHAPRHHDHPHA